MSIEYVSPRSLTPSDRDAIWSFFSRYVRRDRATFEAKLASVDEVFLVRRRDGGVLAFGAIEVVTSDYRDESHGLLLTHWAALDPALRGRNVIQRVGLRYFLRYRAAHPTRRVYWLFGASTFKSYLLLTRNCRDYWPRHDQGWPERERSLVADVMRQHPDVGWDPEAGVIRRFGASRYREGVVVDDPAARLDPDVRFYGSLNPGQDEGDTLLCICPLTLDNWRSIAAAATNRAAMLARKRASRVLPFRTPRANEPLTLPPPPY